jgi:hypothetical protein
MRRLAGDAWEVLKVINFNADVAVDERKEVGETNEWSTGYSVYKSSELKRALRMPEVTAIRRRHNPR